VHLKATYTEELCMRIRKAC